MLNETFCGNPDSAGDGGPAMGECGRCKLNADGTGGFSDCSSTNIAADACADIDNTCGSNKVCCSDGSCQADASDCP